jgi:hypothetical protein
MGFGLGPDDDVDIPGRLRYGMSTADKEAAASSRSLPGAPADNTADQDVANRYAAGYLFAQQHPHLAPVVQPLIDALKTSDLPIFGGASPELQSYAHEGMTRALAERDKTRGAAQASALRSYPHPQPSQPETRR